MKNYDDEGMVLKIRCREADYGKLASGLRDASRGQVVIFRN